MLRWLINKICLIGILIFTFWGISFGDSKNSISNTWNNYNTINCIKNKFKIIWLKHLKVNSPVEYLIKTKENLPFKWTVVFIIKDSSNKIIFKYTGEKISYIFKSPWQYTINAFIKEENWCQYSLTKKVFSYDKIILYIWTDNPNIKLISDLLKANKINIYIDKIIIPEKWFLSQQQLINLFINHSYYFSYSDDILIFFPQINYILDWLKKIKTIYNINLNNKNLIIILKSESNLLKKLVLKYMAILKIKKLIVVKENNLLDFFSTYIWLKEGKISNYIHTYTIEENPQQKVYLLNKIVDWLLYNWFPSNLLAILMLISLVLVIITFFRQMIWFSVFWVYNPLVFWLSLYLLGIKFSIIILLFAIIAIKITNIIIRKVYLLYSAKLTLFYILYILTTILGIYYLIKYNIINILNFEIIKNSLLIFPIISIGIVANKLITEETKILSFKFLVSIFEFSILSIISFFIFSNNYLQTLFLVYPDLIILCLLITIIIGRFTWLQLFEYFRFFPLIKKQFEEE